MNELVDRQWSFTTTLTEGDWLSGTLLFYRRQWTWTRLAVSLGLIWLAYGVLIIAIDTIEYGWYPEWAFWSFLNSFKFSLIIFVLVMGFTWIRIPSLVRKLARDNEKFGNKTDFKFDYLGFSSTTPFKSISLPWPMFNGWIENDHCLVLVATESSIYVIPKAALDASTLDAIKSALIAAGVPKR